jgi:hypothetical protein
MYLNTAPFGPVMCPMAFRALYGFGLKSKGYRAGRDFNPKKARKTLGFLARYVCQSGCFGTVCPTWGKEPRVRIHSTPPFSPPLFVLIGESLAKRACARFGSRMDPESVVKSESTFQKKAFHAIRDIDGATKVVAMRAVSGPATTTVAC